MNIRFLGHSAFALEHDGTTILIDPFLTGNPKAVVLADELQADVILLTHGHADHLGDTVAIAKRTGAEVVAIVELANEIAAKLGEGHTVHDPNLGGTVTFAWGSVKLVPAWHTGTTPDGTVHTPAGLLITFGAKTIYHLGDTALFSDLGLVGRNRQIDLAISCIGGHYTMDRFDALEAVKLIGPREVIPCHYNTFPPIETDVHEFKADVERETSATVQILNPGESHTL